MLDGKTDKSDGGVICDSWCRRRKSENSLSRVKPTCSNGQHAKHAPRYHMMHIGPIDNGLGGLKVHLISTGIRLWYGWEPP